jgi:hypothetical protein
MKRFFLLVAVAIAVSPGVAMAQCYGSSSQQSAPGSTAGGSCEQSTSFVPQNGAGAALPWISLGCTRLQSGSWKGKIYGRTVTMRIQMLDASRYRLDIAFEDGKTGYVNGDYSDSSHAYPGSAVLRNVTFDDGTSYEGFGLCAGRLYARAISGGLRNATSGNAQGSTYFLDDQGALLGLSPGR